MKTYKLTLKPSNLVPVAVSAALALISLPAFGQDSLDTEEPPPATEEAAPAGQEAQPHPLPITFTVTGAYQVKSDIDGGGSFALARVGVRAGLPIRLTDTLVLMNGISYGLDSYDFDGGSPWKNIHTFAVTSLLQYRMDDHWSIYGGPLLRLSAESGADFSRGFSGGGLAGFNYKFSDTLSLGGGLAVVSQIEDDAMVLPLVTANWQFAEAWRLKVGFVDVATFGYGAAVVWNLNEQWEFQFGAQFHKSRFRIETADAVGQERSALLFAQATWHASPMIDFGGFVGIATGGNLRIEDSSGHRITDSDYDATAVFGLKLNIKL